jgi:hypothetical protein
MSWRSLEFRFDQLPLVLAGPILRRVTPESVSVWLALKQSVGVRLVVRLDGDLLFASQVETPTTIGGGLHIICITAKSPNASSNLWPGQLYTYDIEFGNGQRLADAARIPLSYANIGAPSFVLPPTDTTKLHLAQGS